MAVLFSREPINEQMHHFQTEVAPMKLGPCEED
jgi:hypothetical protein